MVKWDKVIGFIDLFGKINAIIVKDGKVEVQETDLKKNEYFCD